MRNTGPTRTTRNTVVARACVHGHPRCERCGAAPPEQIHHRRPRSAGGSRRESTNQPSNLLALCGQCHRRIESDRHEAYRNGWLVRSSFEPANVPVLYRQRDVLLDDHGQIGEVS